MLEELERQRAAQANASAKPPPSTGRGSDAGQERSKKGEPEASPGGAKQGDSPDTAGAKGEAKDKGNMGKQGIQPNPDGKEPAGVAKGAGAAKPGSPPARGTPGNGTAESPDGPASTVPDSTPKNADDEARRQEAGNLLLQQFKIWVDKDVLKNAKVDPEKSAPLPRGTRAYLARAASQARGRPAKGAGGAANGRLAGREERPRGRHRQARRRDRGNAGAGASGVPRRRTRLRDPACEPRQAKELSPMPLPHRYLVRFGPKQTPHLFTDVLVIGAGIAGLRAALEVPPGPGRAGRHQGQHPAKQQRLRPGRHRRRAVARGSLREPHRGHAHRRGRAVRPGRRRDGGPRGAAPRSTTWSTGARISTRRTASSP